jgi:branched-chain amino acid transport system substrate-binding protein
MIPAAIAMAYLLGTTAIGYAQDKDPIVIGAAVALSGAIAPYDDGPYKGMEIAIEEINAKGGVLGRPLKLIDSDTKSDISYGATAAQNVIDEGAAMVVVTCDYDYGGAAANVANSKNLITFSTCAGDPKFGPDGIGPNAYTMATSSTGEGTIMAEWAYSQGKRTAYILLGTDTAFDASFSDAFKKRWTALAGETGIVGEDTFGGEDPQIATQITRMKSLAKQPDVIVVASYPPPGASAVKQIRAAGIDAPILGSDSWDGDFWLAGVPDLKDMYFVTYASMYGTDTRPEMKAFFETFRKKFGALPTQSNAVTGYSVIQAWAKAAENAKSIDADAVRTALNSFKGEPLLAGPTTFSETTHINHGRDMMIMEVVGGKQGKAVTVYAAKGL